MRRVSFVWRRAVGHDILHLIKDPPPPLDAVTAELSAAPDESAMLRGAMDALRSVVLPSIGVAAVAFFSQARPRP